MHFATDDDVVALADSVEDFFARRGDAEAIATASTGRTVASRDRWSALCAMGLPVLCVPEPDGIGASVLDATTVAEKFGAVLLPEPATASIVLASALTGHSAAATQLEDLCSGTSVTTLAAFGHAVLSPAGGVTGRIRVSNRDIADVAVVLARDEYTDGPVLVVLDWAALAPAPESPSMDPTRPLVTLELAGVEPVGVVRLTEEQADRLRVEMAVLSTAELVGSMQRVLNDTVAFAGSREQFGRPIGSFQVIKHQLADAYALTEQARALVQLAAVSYADDKATAHGVVESAVRWVPKSAITLCETAIHLHGAMGYSWEVAVHLHLRRAMVTRTMLSDFAPATIAEAV